MERLGLILIFVGCFSLTTYLQPWFETWNAQRNSSGSVLNALIGDSRRLFANHFFAKADAYFHSGYYPTIFDNVKTGPTHIEEVARDSTVVKMEGHDPKAHEEEESDFMGRPRDWIESFGRNFFPTTHSHLEKNGDEREMLPWFQLAVELDPKRPDIYVTAAFWLRHRLGKIDEAEKFLREGLRQNPDSYEILLELGRVNDENKKNPALARNLWELALQKWHQQQTAGLQPNDFTREQILGFLTRLEEREGHLKQLLFYLQELKKVSPNQELIAHRIEAVKVKISAGAH